MPATLKDFQELVCSGIVARLDNVRALYAQLSPGAPAQMALARRRDGAVVLQAPTGAGKTLVAVEAMRRTSAQEQVLWFWFAPFAGLVEQSRAVIAAQAPELDLFDLDSDRRLDTVRGGGVFVTTWASLAARSADSRRARTRSDDGLSIDEVIAQARIDGLRIGCIVDEAHHGFHKAAQARAFFTDVLAPDYTVMMTATPRDTDVAAFEKATGYEVGTPADWASVSRHHAVEAGLLKRGVRLVRFLARDGDTAQLIDFEHLALRECAAMHRQIQRTLADAGVTLTPLMLVQVPDGKAAQEDARRFLVDQLKFDASAVRVHTADEPDPDLLSLAQDPTVEVLIFKMAVALGFDAPRAFTLAALRGVRDPGFAVQVIGRIVRRHALLQTRDDLPPMLDHGYVFLANAQAQEGLLDAGVQINALTTQAPELGTQTVVTVIGDAQQVQVVRSGEPLSLLVSSAGAQVVGTLPDGAAVGQVDPAAAAFGAEEGPRWEAFAQSLLGLSGGEGERPATEAGLAAPMLALSQASAIRYPRRADVPDSLRSERLPQVSADFDAQLVTHVDFNHEVLASRLRTRVQLARSEGDLFKAGGVQADESIADIWAQLEPAAVADRAEQIRLRLPEANDRELHGRLLERFREAIERSGAEVPTDDEVLMQQLDLVQVRNPQLLRDAYRRLRHAQVADVAVVLPAEFHSDVRLASARRGSYGVFPPDLNNDERAVAQMLDANAAVRWWHRNLPSKADSVGLYRWDDGAGFFPDFVVALNERNTPGGIALLEFKGDQFWGKDSEVEKAAAVHPDYGRVFMVGRRRGENDFSHLRELGGRLQTDGAFEVGRLRFV
jgi:Type III restriction enzyme, res subunit